MLCSPCLFPCLIPYVTPCISLRWIYFCCDGTCIYVFVCMRWRKSEFACVLRKGEPVKHQTPSGTNWLLCSCYPLFAVCSCLCSCDSVYHSNVEVSLQQTNPPVCLHFIMHEYFCMCETLYAVWSLGVSFFFFLTSGPLICGRSWSSWANWLQHHMTEEMPTKYLSACVLQLETAFHAIGCSLSLPEYVLCVCVLWCMSVVEQVQSFPYIPCRSLEADPCPMHFACLHGPKKSHMSALCIVHTGVMFSDSHFQWLQVWAVCLFIFMFGFTSCLPVYPSIGLSFTTALRLSLTENKDTQLAPMKAPVAECEQ